MDRNVVLRVTSLLSIVLASLHFVDDIVYGSDTGTSATLIIVAVLTIWLYGAVVLPETQTGRTIMLLGSLAGLTIFVVHVRGAGGLLGGELGHSSGAFFFVWTLLALAVVSLVSFVLAIAGLWSGLRSR